MGFIDFLRSPTTSADLEVTAAAVDEHISTTLAEFGIAQPNHLESIVYEDVFGIDPELRPVTRAEAMRMPPVARARNLLTSTICRIPLRAYVKDAQAERQPAWLTATATESPILRIAYTVDDLIFHGYSVWYRDENAAEDGRPLRVHRLNRDEWRFDHDGHVYLTARGRVARHDEVIVFAGLHEGILDYGRDALQDARALYRNVRVRLNNPVPLLNLQQAAGGPTMTDPEVDALIARWSRARKGRNGGVSFTNAGIEPKEMGSGGDNLLIESRNAQALDLARVVGVSAGRIDATAPKASLNYETTTGRNQEFVDFDLALYMTPITARLSMDDVVPSGWRVEFDLADFTAPAPAASGPIRED